MEAGQELLPAVQSTFNIKTKAVQVFQVHTDTVQKIVTGVGSKSADFVCETCGKGFSSLDRLQDHQHRERPARKHACAYCPYSSSNRSHVTRHERGHTGERPFVCQACQKGYRCREHLEAHGRAHSRLR